MHILGRLEPFKRMKGIPLTHLLYRLGRFAARRAWTVIAGWLVILVAAAIAFLFLGGTLASNFSIPGTETERVTDELTEELGNGGASSTVVFQSSDSKALTQDQQEQISDALAGLTDMEHVTDVVDPFTATQEREAGEQQLADGRMQIDDAEADLDAGQAELDDARAEIDAAIEQLGSEAGFEDALAELDTQQETLDTARIELEAQSDQLDLAERLLEYTAEIRSVSADETTALGVIVFDEDMFALPQEAKQAIIDELEAADISGVDVEFSSEIASSVDGLVGVSEVIGVIVAAIVLLVMLRALLPALLPVVSSLVGVGVGVLASLSMSDVVDMTNVTPILGVMLGLAVGIDYALFIINRHRRQVMAGMDVAESIGVANGTAGNAVVFAGSTVFIALLALNVTGISFLGVMGSVGAASVLIAVLVAISLVPALLGLLDVRVVNRKARARIGADDDGNGVQPMKTPRAVLALVVAVAGLLVIAIPAMSMRLGLPDGSSESPDSTQYRAYTVTAEAFGPGQNGPLVVTASLPSGVSEEDELAQQVELAGALMEHEDVVAVAPAGVSDARDFFAFQVVPIDGPSSESTEELVHDLRDMSPLDGDITIGVAGAASGNIDISEKLADAMPIYLVVVIGLSLLIMIVVLRSLLIPIIATGGFILSLFAALGSIVAVYQWGWLGDIFEVTDPGPLLNFAPLIIIGVLFGLAMDYQLFMVSGMREAYAHGLPAREAITAGARAGRAVVIAAAIIMISVFGGFVFSHLAMVRPIGFGLAIGVLFDAFVVRMVIVPTIMHLFGNAAWWLPKWLDRILPNVDVEGAALEREHPVAGVKEPVAAGTRTS